MRKLLVILLPLILTLAGCSVDNAKGNGNITTQQRTVPVFNKVEVSGAVNVLVATGKAQKVAVTTDSNLQSDVVTTVRDDTLYIAPKKGVSLQPSKTTVVTLRCKKLEGIVSHGDVFIKVTNLVTDKFEVRTSGSSKVDLRGQAKKLTIHASGSAIINTVPLKADKVKVVIEGNADVKVYANNTLDINIAGAGTVHYAGNPEITQEVHGSGKILKIA